MIKTLILFLIAATLTGQSFIENGNLGKFDNAESFSISGQGFIYVSDSGTNEVYKLDTLGNVKEFVGGFGWDDYSFDFPADVFATTLNVYITDKNNHRIQIFDRNLNFLSSFDSENISNGDYAFAYPVSCATSSQGDLFILDSENKRVLKYNLTGDFLLEIGNYDAGSFALNDPKKFAIVKSSKIFVIDKEQLIIFDLFGTGLSKVNLNIDADNIHYNSNVLSINDERRILFLDISTKSQSFEIFEPELETGLRIKEVLFHNNKLYVLTNKTILIFQKLIAK
ncbi:MAG: NHL repeat-containing protein [Melioribacteraceae bacterium]|nr:NHL repeat-containing protein [Melioribacteraceae bacterium]MCF8394950.1 NHL repeat-containing protein [Melioribacteraceae bacterium]MCF8420175.1 NHL repeat-containing protein [Melioribacteraceae bacterium]